MARSIDTTLIIITAVVWFAVALVYHFSPLVDMPDAERVWTLSSLVFLAIMFWVQAADRRGRRMRALKEAEE